MTFVGEVIYVGLTIFIFLLFARFVMDWVQIFARDWTPTGASLVLMEALYSVTDPPINAVRRILPPIRLGQMALDLSPLIVLVICILLQRLDAAILLN